MKIRNVVDFLAWFAVSGVVGVLLSSGFAQAQQHEIGFGTSIVSAPQSGYGFPFYSNGVGGQVHVGMFDLGGGYSRGNFPKRGTPGGYRTGLSAHAAGWFLDDRFFVGTNWSRVFGDATVWTKEVEFVGASAGLRFVGGQRLGPPKIVLNGNGGFRQRREVLPGRHVDIISFGYDREVKTDAIQPNNSEYFGVRWLHDFPLNGWMAMRSSVGISYGTFDQFVFHADDPRGGGIERLSTTSWSFGVSFVIKNE